MDRIRYALYRVCGPGFLFEDEAETVERFFRAVGKNHLIIKGPSALFDNYLAESCIEKILKQGGKIIQWPAFKQRA